LARSHHPPSRSPPNSRRTLPINSTINWRNLGANESKSEAVYVRMWRGYYIRWAVRCILRGRGWRCHNFWQERLQLSPAGIFLLHMINISLIIWTVRNLNGNGIVC
jgi:hypothetical protein